SFFFLLPNVLLSGFMFPREAMPPVAHEIGLVLPLTYYLQMMRGIILKGAGLEALWPQALMLVAFAALFFTFATLRFHKQLDWGCAHEPGIRRARGPARPARPRLRDHALQVLGAGRAEEEQDRVERARPSPAERHHAHRHREPIADPQSRVGAGTRPE